MDKDQEIDWLDIVWGQIRDFWIFLVGVFLDHICFWIFVWKIGEGNWRGSQRVLISDGSQKLATFFCPYIFGWDFCTEISPTFPGIFWQIRKGSEFWVSWHSGGGAVVRKESFDFR